MLISSLLILSGPEPTKEGGEGPSGCIPKGNNLWLPVEGVGEGRTGGWMDGWMKLSILLL
jgi:hypothetical protein